MRYKTEIKGIYITSENMNDKTSGVQKKINMQIDAFKKLRIDLEAPDLSTDGTTDKIVRRLPLIKNGFEKKLALIVNSIKKNNSINKNQYIDFVYIRHPMVSLQFVLLMKKIKRLGVCIIYEFPTFPYDKNSKKLSGYLSLIKDKFSRGQLYKFVDVGVNYSGYREIFGIPCLQLSNGIDVHKVREKTIRENHSNVIRFIGVALLTRWNGYDRLIKAIYKRSKVVDIDVEFHIVGKGDAFSELNSLVKELDLEKQIVLHGPLYGEELDALYDICDIGVGTLNPSRKYKNHIMSSLKTKEYAAKGIPFIKGDIDIAFDQRKPDFVFEVNDDESELNLTAILDWYRDLCHRCGKEELVKKIRKFASKELTWEKQLEPVATYIKEKCKNEDCI